MEHLQEKLLEEKARLEKEVRERTLGYIVTALGLVAGLAWNDAIRSAINTLIPGERGTLMAQFIYAIAITVVVVLLATYLTRLFSQAQPKQDKV